MAANPIAIPPRTLEIDFRISDNGTPTLACRGSINASTCEQFKNEVKKNFPQNKLVIVDLSYVNYVDSSGLGTMLGTYISAKTNGCALKLVNLSQPVKQLLQLTRLASVFEGYGEYL